MIWIILIIITIFLIILTKRYEANEKANDEAVKRFTDSLVNPKIRKELYEEQLNDLKNKRIQKQKEQLIQDQVSDRYQFVSIMRLLRRRNKF